MIRSSPTTTRLLSALRHQSPRSSFRVSHAPAPRRFASTSPASAPSSWRSFFVRLGLAGGVIYYYNTSPVFSNEPAMLHMGPESSESSLPTLESIAAKKRQQTRQAQTASSSALAQPESASGISDGGPPLGSETPIGDPSALEDEAGQQGAFNPETGEINWDCPCLGGMAHGPCGEEFKAAFSCFVYSENEPKGMECVDKFKGMQDCFRAHPDVYGAELEDDEEAADASVDHEKDKKTEGDENSKSKDTKSVVDKPAAAPAPLERPSKTTPESSEDRSIQTVAKDGLNDALKSAKESVTSVTDSAKAEARDFAQKSSDKSMK
ncbi:hypothetical protein BT63DRAFT_407029 [Microthyrium microscopicum]|uniref:Mitochondrial intermembrane space import and assembly protein 40 n=1 Tax=Microthyrium microscopicum TaxID=703497 RepID=A0A6A6TXU2_9PEZI|nr:hypothetical protein BT63DRAFT_407029 [Microthyrium microscopicum]